MLGKAPQITTNDAPSLEAIIGRRPDIVVSYELSSTDLPAGLSAAGIETVRFIGPDTPSWKRGPRAIPGRGPRDTYG